MDERTKNELAVAGNAAAAGSLALVGIIGQACRTSEMVKNLVGNAVGPRMFEIIKGQGGDLAFSLGALAVTGLVLALANCRNCGSEEAKQINKWTEEAILAGMGVGMAIWMVSTEWQMLGTKAGAQGEDMVVFLAPLVATGIYTLYRRLSEVHRKVVV